MPNDVRMRHAEHEQAGHGDRDGEGGEDHGRAGGGDGLDDGVVDVAAVAAFLAEPVDHQQPVVDAEADAEHVDDVDREDRHVAEQRRADQDGERGDDAAEGDEQRHAGGAQPAEQEDHGHDGDRQGDGLAAQEVVLRGGARTSRRRARCRRRAPRARRARGRRPRSRGRASSSASSSRPPASVTTTSAARPSVARRASAPVDHGSATSMTPSIAAIRSSPAADATRRPRGRRRRCRRR